MQFPKSPVKEVRGKGARLGIPMKSVVTKRSIVLDGHKTSVTLEDAFWNELKKIAQFQSVTLSKLVVAIDAARKHPNLSSAIRVFVLEHLQHEGRRTLIRSGEQ
jgi:predicted DNA-binding ribbon-helix-helix protein